MGLVLLNAPSCEAPRRSSSASSPDTTRDRDLPARSDTASPASADSASEASASSCGTRANEAGCASPLKCEGIDRDDTTVDLTEFLCAAASDAPRSRSLAEVLALLPAAVRKNFTAKHGRADPGLRGHAFEVIEDVVGPEIAANGQSALPDQPRVLLWDEQTGFTLSFNSGLPGQTGADRLDVLRFDHDTHAFELWAVDLPLTTAPVPYQPHTPADDCAHCHGPDSRPIWPMYPDWPGFYGSDNDELTEADSTPNAEGLAWAQFRDCVASPSGERTCPAHVVADTRDRFSSLFAPDLFEALRDRKAWAPEALPGYVRSHPRNFERSSRGLALDDRTTALDWLGVSRHATYPFRPNGSEKSAEPSRAFFHRPNLRIGVLYNRLLARAVMARLHDDPVYRSHRRWVALHVMNCGWDGDDVLASAAGERFAQDASARWRAAGLRTPPTTVSYPQLLAALGLRVRDVDMRFSYPNAAFDTLDVLTEAVPTATGPMDLGLIPYAASDPYAANDATHYFNSYFDGTATFDELWAARILDDLSRDDPRLAAVYRPHALTTKYERFVSRWILDGEFFAQMDALGTWMSLPYPQHLRRIHDREPFLKRATGTARFIEPYRAVCRELRRGIAQAQAQGSAQGSAP